MRFGIEQIENFAFNLSLRSPFRIFVPESVEFR